MSYREHAPPPELAPWLDCIWERWDDGEPLRVLPDGCIDIVWVQHQGAHVVGPNQTAFEVSLPLGTHAVGARMLPGTAGALLPGVIVAEALRDGRVPVHVAWPAAGGRLEEALQDSPDPATTLRRALVSALGLAITPDPLVSAAVARLRSPAAAVHQLADELAVSERQLRRRVSAAVGYGPKRLARVFRLQRALEAARSGDELAAAAYAAGYADQAHFSGECRALAGVPPSALTRPFSPRLGAGATALLSV